MRSRTNLLIDSAAELLERAAATRRWATFWYCRAFGLALRLDQDGMRN
jgi:hypothetical protein